jgi:hypothetical protein
VTESTARSPRPAACWTTPVATRLTRATGDWVRRRDPPDFRPLDFLDDPPDFRRDEPPLLRPEDDFLPPLLRPDDEDLRPPLLPRREDLRPDDLRPDDLRPDDLRPDDLRALPERPPERLRPDDDLRPPVERRPPLLRPEDPDRDLFLPPRELLDFLAAAIGMLRDGGFVEPIARTAHNNAMNSGSSVHGVHLRSTLQQEFASHHDVESPDPR